MAGDTDQEILAKIRTLLALERNYLAEERTALAEFRTGLALTVIGPTASTFLAYLFSSLPLTQALLYDVVNFAVFSVLTIWGIWTSVQSRSMLREIRRKKRIIDEREAALVKISKPIHDLLCECITSDEENIETRPS